MPGTGGRAQPAPWWWCAARYCWPAVPRGWGGPGPGTPCPPPPRPLPNCGLQRGPPALWWGRPALLRRCSCSRCESCGTVPVSLPSLPLPIAPCPTGKLSSPRPCQHHGPLGNCQGPRSLTRRNVRSIRCKFRFCRDCCAVWEMENENGTLTEGPSALGKGEWLSRMESPPPPKGWVES